MSLKSNEVADDISRQNSITKSHKKVKKHKEMVIDEGNSEKDNQ